MGLQNDVWIRRMIKEYNMIQNASNASYNSYDDSGKRVISSGISSYGYDMMVSNEFKIFTNLSPGIIDPKNFHLNELTQEVKTNNYIVLPPNSFALARSIEYFKIPRHVMTICIGKSTYARCGVLVNVTAFEPEWEGHVTIEISNTTTLPVKIYANEGIAQVIFFVADEVCETSYKDKSGKYQGQTGITGAR